jgi:ribonuclease HI
MSSAHAPSSRHPIRIWSDGSCAPNPGPGGWGAIVERGSERRELFGNHPASTNNIMELTAAIEALRTTPPGAHVILTTDSLYVKDGITRWITAWKRKGWRKSDGKPVLNQDYWRALDELAQQRHVSWEWVRGHDGHPENERCDELANQAREALRR